MSFLPEELLTAPLGDLCRRAREVRDRAHGRTVSYSPKVFIPLTRLCRDVCGYCAYRRPAGETPAYLDPREVLEIVGRGQGAGCREALFVLGERPEERHQQARRWLKRRGFDSSAEYLASICRMVLRESRLIPHSNAGTLTRREMEMLAECNGSLGLMLESASERLCQPGGPHAGAPGKLPKARLEQLRLAGELGIPFTTGILIGIGETPRERLEALDEVRRVHDRWGHIQEVIIQNFRRKASTPMEGASELAHGEVLRTIAWARLVLGGDMNLQAPPNLSQGERTYLDYPDAGINDWGGLSPVTPDHVNPEAPWPHLRELERAMAERGYRLRPRLAVYPGYIEKRWAAPSILRRLRSESDGEGYLDRTLAAASVDTARLLGRTLEGRDLDEEGLTRLLASRGADHEALLRAADRLRREQCGDEASYVVNRNINFTNVCVKRCRFCAFSRTRRNREGYFLPIEEVVRRAREAWDYGATEVCIQAGLAPDMAGDYYVRLCGAVKEALPRIHIHGFSPEEVVYASRRWGRGVREVLEELKAAGVGSLPGTSAEILDDQVRRRISPGRLTSGQWVEVIRTAHELGIPTTSTIMYGHVETPRQAARHLLLLRGLQRETGGITEFVPLSFVHREAPLFLDGLVPEVRPGATRREVFNMHAAARLALGRDIPNIQASWVKEGLKRAGELLSAGANDLGGTLINESISTSAGASHGQLAAPSALRRLIRRAGRVPVERSTLYETLRRFERPEDDPEEPLEAFSDRRGEAFGSYESLTRSQSFRFRQA